MGMIFQELASFHPEHTPIALPHIDQLSKATESKSILSPISSTVIKQDLAVRPSLLNLSNARLRSDRQPKPRAIFWLRSYCRASQSHCLTQAPSPKAELPYSCLLRTTPRAGCLASSGYLAFFPVSRSTREALQHTEPGKKGGCEHLTIIAECPL